MLNIGYGNSVSKIHVVGVVKNEGASIRRHRTLLKDSLKLVDATLGHKARRLIVMDSGHIFLSSVEPDTLVKRFCKEK